MSKKTNNQKSINDSAVRVLKRIIKDVGDDAKKFDGGSFDGRTVAEYFAHHGAAIAAVAKIIMMDIEARK